VRCEIWPSLARLLLITSRVWHIGFQIITGCAVAQHCCKGDQPFISVGTPKFDPSYFPNSLIFCTKICTDDYVQHIFWYSKFGENPFTGGFRTNRWNITLAWLFVPFLSFSFFLAVLYRKNDWTDFNARWLIWRGFAQGSAFWGLQNLNSTFSPIFSPKYEKLQQFTFFSAVALPSNNICKSPALDSDHLGRIIF